MRSHPFVTKVFIPKHYQSLTLLSMIFGGCLWSSVAAANVASGLGTFTLDGGGSVTAVSASGSYTTTSGETGRFTITQNASEGYGGTPTYQGGNNGLQVSNPDSTVSNDRFRYTLTLTPNNTAAINTIKIAQTSYENSTNRNSEVAKQTLSYTPNALTSASSRAYIASNPDVPLLYNAMGDYFMGKKISTNPIRYQTDMTLKAPQLRLDSSDTPIYYYKFEYLGLNRPADGSGFDLTIGPDGYVTKTSNYGVLPPNPNPNNILKPTSTNPNNQTTYQALNEGTTIPNGGSYVSYGVTNADTRYVINVYDANSVTLDYKGIMIGSSAISNPNLDEPKVGETIREWITFGVESTPPPDVIPAPPNSTAVQCPAGMIADTFALTDYQGIAAANNGSLVNIDGKNNESYIQAKLTRITNNVTNTSFSTLLNNTYNQPYFRYTQDPSNQSGNTVFTYEFINRFNGSPQELSQFTLSLFDIDADDNRFSANYEVQDQVKIVGFNGTTGPLNPTKKDQGAYVQGISPTFYTPSTNIGSQNQCTNGNFDGKCQVTVKFDQAVTKVEITFNNYTGGLVNNPDPQDFETVISGYCYSPQPRLIYTKKLDGPRINDSDQFKVQIKDLTTAGQPVVTDTILSATTQGSGNIVSSTTGTTGTFKVDPTRTYSLTEAAAGTTTLSQYTPTYDCTKADGTKVATLDPNNLKLTYGDNWTCTITNKAKTYTFSGIVFNDNGGISSANKNDVSATYTGNANYFNGLFDSGETGIYESGLKVALTDCNNNIIENAKDVISSGADIGKYTISISQADLFANTAVKNSNQVCLVEYTSVNNGILEEKLTTYPVDTTANKKVINLASNPNQIDYPNNNFGEVSSDNAALVLQKRQYIADCTAMKSKPLNDPSINTQDVTNTMVPDTVFPRVGFSKNEPKLVTDAQGNTEIIPPGLCIAYKITAINRGHLPLSDVQISDTLQTNKYTTYYLTDPAPITPDNVGLAKAPAKGSNGQIITNGFGLPAVTAPSNAPTFKSLFFNTRYGNQP